VAKLLRRNGRINRFETLLHSALLTSANKDDDNRLIKRILLSNFFFKFNMTSTNNHVLSIYVRLYRVVQKTDTLCFVRLNFIKYWPISNLFHCLNRENICNNNVAKDFTTPQVCRYTTLWNVSVLKATVENKTTSVTTHFKSASYGSKVDTLNIWTITAGCVSYFR